jgi:predicted nucleic acid-binding protein
LPAPFADTGYFLALVNPRDALHSSARSWCGALDQPIVTTSWVVQELADGLCAPATRATFVRIFASMEADPETTIIPFEAALGRRGLDLYARRPDKAWSLTDCISFVVMSERGMTEALTGDHHFEQAGFRALLLPWRGRGRELPGRPAWEPGPQAATIEASRPSAARDMSDDLPLPQDGPLHRGHGAVG